MDFESLSAEAADGYLEFIRELSIKCENNDIVLSVDNYVPASYNSFYDCGEQAVFADYIVIMAYDEHYNGSDEGSVASIGFVRQGIEDDVKGCSGRAGDPWSSVLHKSVGADTGDCFRGSVRSGIG